MAPYGACEVTQSTARSKAQFEAERFRKDFRRKKNHCRKCFRRKKKHARAVIASVGAFKARSSSDFERAVASKEKEVCSSIYFERSVASKEKEACSSTDFERSVASKQVRAVFSSAQWPRRKKKHARAVISNAQWLSAQSKKLRLCSVFECWRGSLGFSAPEWSGEFAFLYASGTYAHA